MCRWLAYVGDPIYLDHLLFKPENSLIQQSLHARKAMLPTQGDGFGVGWYAHRPEPGLYRDLRPAWNDENLKSMAEQIKTGTFFAHVRASTGTAASRANCHPFRHGRWLFMHNGAVGGFDHIARELDFRIAAPFYRARQGTTDSETFFYLLFTNGLEADPEGAIARTVAEICEVMQAAKVEEPFRLTAALTDGERVYAVRWSSDAKSPTLFHGDGAHVCHDAGQGRDARQVLILSEPLDTIAEHWRAVPEGHLLVCADRKVSTRPL
jgi:glutamine amidotransferase